MNLILLKSDEICASRVTLAAPDRRFIHIRDVLKPVQGETLRVGVLSGARYDARLERISEDSCEMTLVAESPTLPRPDIDILLALPRPKCLKRLLPQVAALGIGRLYIVGAEKVEKEYWGSRFLLPELYQPLLEEGLEQSGDTIPPEIIISRRLKPLLEDIIAPRYENKFIAHPGPWERGRLARFMKTDAGEPPALPDTILAIGPEGGWTDYELSMFERLNFTRFSLGPRILRADTAVVSCVAALTNWR